MRVFAGAFRVRWEGSGSSEYGNRTLRCYLGDVRVQAGAPTYGAGVREYVLDGKNVQVNEKCAMYRDDS